MARTPRTRSAGPDNGWRSVPLAPLVLLYGPEEYFASRATQRLRQLFEEAHGSYELTSLSAKDYRAGQLDVLASPSLFDEPKIIEVTQVASMSDAFLQDALAYAAAPHDSTLVVLHHAGGNRGKKLIDTIKANKSCPVVECKALTSSAQPSALLTRPQRQPSRQQPVIFQN